jgi:hypothetical protein
MPEPQPLPSPESDHAVVLRAGWQLWHAFIGFLAADA